MTNDNDSILGKDAIQLRKFLDRRMFDIPLGTTFLINNKSYLFKPFFLSKGVHAIDRCDKCEFEDTKYCNILKCTPCRSDMQWAYIVEDKPVDAIIKSKYPDRKHVVCEC